jgi:hypothetical protein
VPAHEEPDIRVRVGFFKHPKTVKLRRRLGGDGPLCLLALWAFARVNRIDGNLVGMSDEDIEIAAGWDGTPGALTPALVDTRWLDGPQGERSVHGWEETQRWAMALCAMSEAGKASAEVRKAKYGSAQPQKPKVAEQPSTKSPKVPEQRPEGRSDVRPNSLPLPSASALPKPEPLPIHTDSVPSERLSAGADLHPLAKAWNDVAEAEGLPKVSVCAGSRLRHAKARLAEADVETWTTAYRLIAQDPFCRGENDRGWRANFDYAVRPEKSGRWLDAARNGAGAAIVPLRSPVNGKMNMIEAARRLGDAIR